MFYTYVLCRANHSSAFDLGRVTDSHRPASETKVYIEYLRVSPIVITVSFLPTDWGVRSSPITSGRFGEGSMNIFNFQFLQY